MIRALIWWVGIRNEFHVASSTSVPDSSQWGTAPQHAESLLGGLGIRNLYVPVLIRVDA